jgi:aminopeptidase N
LVLDIDTRNPSLSSRLVSYFNQWKRFDPKRQALMKAELERIVAKPGLSAGVFEIASKALS